MACLRMAVHGRHGATNWPIIGTGWGAHTVVQWSEAGLEHVHILLNGWLLPLVDRCVVSPMEFLKVAGINNEKKT